MKAAEWEYIARIEVDAYPVYTLLSSSIGADGSVTLNYLMSSDESVH